MTHYLVKHSEGDVRLHAEDGSEPLSSGWSEWPSPNDVAEQCAADGPGGSLLGQDVLREVFVDAVSGEIHKRDLTLDGESVPW
ncbi:hypothetical protein [Halobacterium sp. KA-6]|uniref:hypothetical protein n=1 Tax=Halobacterium sp. KA-6 TaxID=2896368 RepID=UPI001E5DD593|nr:hypothetical protein [Halobacterium sp. KA-6]MCD2202733.1 hypothetical protein [Halobacterium sp. KA-6]